MKPIETTSDSVTKAEIRVLASISGTATNMYHGGPTRPRGPYTAPR